MKHGNEILATVIDRTHARKIGGGWKALCPAHDDRNPSLSITPKEDRILLHCFAGCSVEAVTAAIGLLPADLFYDHKYEGRYTPASRIRSQSVRPIPRRLDTRNRRQTAAFEYHDEAGNVLAVKRRFDYTAIYNDGSEREEKTFIVSPPKLALPLYSLPAVLSAVRQGWRVYLTEGEAKADLLNIYFREEWGTEAVASSYGGHWRRDMAATLTGAHVVILPDRDEPGRRKADRLVHDLSNVAASVALCDLSDLLTALQAGESGE